MVATQTFQWQSYDHCQVLEVVVITTHVSVVLLQFRSDHLVTAQCLCGGHLITTYYW